MAKTLFITGASTGIGAATARAAVAAGWQVGLFARSAGKLAALAGDLGAAALALPGDATDPAQLEAGVAATVAHFGGLDAAFANAGRGIDRPGTEAGDPAGGCTTAGCAATVTVIPVDGATPVTWTGAITALPAGGPATRMIGCAVGSWTNGAGIGTSG